jgi:hypothetical protein
LVVKKGLITETKGSPIINAETLRRMTKVALLLPSKCFLLCVLCVSALNSLLGYKTEKKHRTKAKWPNGTQRRKVF